MKVGWQAHCRDPEDRGLQWPYLPLRFPLPSHLFMEELDICGCAWDAKQKSCNHSHQSVYRVFVMPPLQLVLMLRKMVEEEEGAFWHRLDLEMQEELDLGPPPPNI